MYACTNRKDTQCSEYCKFILFLNWNHNNTEKTDNSWQGFKEIYNNDIEKKSQFTSQIYIPNATDTKFQVYT